MLRSILHCDMNNFYASVECMLDPALKKYPIAVCGSVEERHGIVLAKNYKAKAFDVKTGDAVWQAKQKCKDLVVVPPHYEEYIKYSKLARSVYTRQWQTKIALPTQSPMIIAKTAFQLFEKRYGWNNPIRSVTVQAINLVPQDTPRQIDMFMDAAKQDKLERIRNDSNKEKGGKPHGKL